MTFNWLAYALHLVVWGVIVLPVHELGHYLVAKRYGWKPKVRLRWWGMEVVAKEMDFSDFVELYVKVATFRASGSLFSLTALLAIQFGFKLYNAQIFSTLMLIIVAYGFWEVTRNPVKKTK